MRAMRRRQNAAQGAVGSRVHLAHLAHSSRANAHAGGALACGEKGGRGGSALRRKETMCHAETEFQISSFPAFFFVWLRSAAGPGFLACAAAGAGGSGTLCGIAWGGRSVGRCRRGRSEGGGGVEGATARRVLPDHSDFFSSSLLLVLVFFLGRSGSMWEESLCTRVCYRLLLQAEGTRRVPLRTHRRRKRAVRSADAGRSLP